MIRARRLLGGVVAVAVTSVLMPLHTSAARPEAPMRGQAAATNGWSGELFMSYDYVNSAPGYESHRIGSATVTNVQSLTESGNGNYTGTVNGSGTDTISYSMCGDPLRLTSKVTWSLAEDRSTLAQPGVFGLTTDSEGRTSFHQVGVWVVGATGTSYGCDGQTTTTPVNTMVLTFGGDSSSPLETLLPDTNPDPRRLVGSRTWTLSDPPEVLYPETTSYTFTVQYDLSIDPQCSDGQDNDDDGDIDYPDDPGCTSPTDLTEDESACDDGIDNDGDGAVDAGADPGCTDPEDVNEHGPAECDNGLDDDLNGKTDWRAGPSGDPGCDSLIDEIEYSDPCAEAAPSERHYTHLEAPARLDVLLAPDPHLASINLGFKWCETPQGPRIMEFPAAADPTGWWTSTENWVLLGSLEAFAGLTIEPTGDPQVTYGTSLARVDDSLSANLNVIDLVLSVIPVGKLFKALKKVLKKYADQLNPLTKKLRKYDGLVRQQTKTVDKTGKAVRKARKEVAEWRDRVAEVQKDLAAATPGSAEYRALRKKLDEYKATMNSAKAAERISSLDHQAAIRELRRIKSEEAKLARQLDALLTKLRSALDKADDLKQRVSKALDDKVKSVRPDWAQEVVRIAVDDVKSRLNAKFQEVKRAMKNLTVKKMRDLLMSGDATGKILRYLQSTYENAVRSLSNVKIPIWDASFTVNLTGNEPTFADNSQSRFIFTIKTEPKLTTS